ncbi:MAG TPA: hypothetical protein VFV70_01510 [Hyphomonadaceae bacterium]|nr:hypothetical protein [Hyphomonadaceae bacterium]
MSKFVRKQSLAWLGIGREPAFPEYDMGTQRVSFGTEGARVILGGVAHMYSYVREIDAKCPFHFCANRWFKRRTRAWKCVGFANPWRGDTRPGNRCRLLPGIRIQSLHRCVGKTIRFALECSPSVVVLLEVARIQHRRVSRQDVGSTLLRSAGNRRCRGRDPDLRGRRSHRATLLAITRPVARQMERPFAALRMPILPPWSGTSW